MNNIIGVDVSKYNLGWNPDKAIKPIYFVIQRAGYGSQYGGAKADEQFDAINTQVQKIPIRGAYWYYSSWNPWKIQADKFLSIVNNKRFHFLCLDYEKSFNTLNARTIAEASEFVKYVKAQTGKSCLFYFNPDTYKTSIKPYGYTNWLNKQDLWVAQYPYSLGQTPLSTKPSIPTEITSWKFWQYGGGNIAFTAGYSAGADYGGGLKGIDLNYFNGTEEELERFAGTETEPIPPATPQTFPWKYRILDDIEAGREIRQGLPSTVRFQGGKGTEQLPPIWMDYIYQIQGNPNYMFSDPIRLKDAVGWHNNGDGNKVEQLGFSGNVVEVTHIEDNKAYIKTVPITDNPPMLGGKFVLVEPTKGTHPLIHNFSIQYRDHLDLDTDGKFARTIVFSNPGEELWIDTREIVRL